MWFHTKERYHMYENHYKCLNVDFSFAVFCHRQPYSVLVVLADATCPLNRHIMYLHSHIMHYHHEIVCCILFDVISSIL